MDYKKLFDEWAASKPDEQISYATAFQLLDFVEWLNKRANQQNVQLTGATCPTHKEPISDLIHYECGCSTTRPRN